MPNYVTSQDPLLDKLRKEMESLNLYSPGSNKPKTEWIGESEYGYGNTHFPPRPFDNTLSAHQELMQRINKEYNLGLDCVVDVCFPNGTTSLSKHADDETVLDQEHPIVTFSIGVDRDIEYYKFRSKHNDPPLKTLTLQEGSIYFMQPGCQSLFKHRIPPSRTNEPRFVVSYRKRSVKEKPFKCTPMAVSSPVKDPGESETIGSDTSADLFGDSSSHVPKVSDNTTYKPKIDINIDTTKYKPKTAIILGTSQQVDLKAEKLAKRGKTCINLSKGGNKISHINNDIDTFYIERSENYDVTTIILAVGINDIRYCRKGINHLKSPLINLINKLKDYFPKCKIYIDSVIPIKINNQFTVSNIYKYNEMLYNICVMTQCYYIDTFSMFLYPGTYIRNVHLYKGPISVHLNRRGLAVLAREYIHLINNERFNPLAH